MIKVYVKSLKMFAFLTGFTLGSVQQKQTGLDAQKKLVKRVVNVPVPLAMVAFPDSLKYGPLEDMVPCLSAAEIEELMTSTPPPTEEELKEAEADEEPENKNPDSVREKEAE